MRFLIEEKVSYEVEAESAQEAITIFLQAPDVCKFSTEVSEREVCSYAGQTESGRDLWELVEVDEEAAAR